MQPSRIQAIDHVDIEAPAGREDDWRWFYGEVALKKIRKIRVTSDRGWCIVPVLHWVERPVAVCFSAL